MSEETMPCPMCDEPAAEVGKPAFPFCSLRCKSQDMYHWLDGTYEQQLIGDDLEDEGGAEA